MNECSPTKGDMYTRTKSYFESGVLHFNKYLIYFF